MGISIIVLGLGGLVLLAALAAILLIWGTRK
jgi:hypothetical protein